MKVEAQSLTYIAGAILVILIPTLTTIAWHMVMRLVDALNRNTHAIIKLEARVDFIAHSTQDIPRLKQDVNALHTKLRSNKDKDGVLES